MCEEGMRRVWGGCGEVCVRCVCGGYGERGRAGDGRERERRWKGDLTPYHSALRDRVVFSLRVSREC